MGKLLMNYMTAFPYRFHFTERDRRECFDVIAKIIKLAYRERQIARENLEEDAYQTDNFFLRKALFLFVDKVDESTIEDILETYIVFGEYQGQDLLEKMIIMDGISSLFKNENPILIEERLKAYIGEQCADDFEKFRDSNDAFEVQAHKKISQPQEDTFMHRQKIVTEPLSSNKVLTQSEIDALVARLLND